LEITTLKKSTKTKLLGGIALLTGVVLLSSCTANFCSDTDKANIAYPYEQGVTVYCDKDQLPEAYKTAAWPVYAAEGNDTLYAYVPVDSTGAFAAQKTSYLKSGPLATATTNKCILPSAKYWTSMDQYVLDAAIDVAGLDKATVKAIDVNPYTVPDADSVSEADGIEINNGALRKYGYIKFLGKNSSGVDTLWTNWTNWTNELRASSDPELGLSNCPNADFVNYYKSAINTKIDAGRSCIATRSGQYGHYGTNSNWVVEIQAKDWNYAWSKGFLEGLIVYPVAIMVDTFAYSMDPSLSGFGQIWAIVLVTLIVRAVLMLLTFKSTTDQQKMQMIQPELAKLQAKYPNSNTNKAEQQRLAQEQMAIYKRHKIKPASSILAMIIQFPVFIAVWSALQGSSVLSSGSFLNLRLSDNIQAALFNTTGTWYLNTTGWWTALVLFLIMSASQFLAMMLPQWITKARNKNMTKLSKNPAQDKASSQMKWVSYGMLIFTIIMGFFLPAAMGVYWSIGAVISMIQTCVTQAIMIKKQNAKKRG
jgi:YidC/Oxa1 family membrane protein insertase